MDHEDIAKTRALMVNVEKTHERTNLKTQSRTGSKGTLASIT